MGRGFVSNDVNIWKVRTSTCGEISMPSRSSESVWPNANGNCGLPYFDSSVNESTESSENHRNLCQKRSSDDVPSWRTRWLPFNRCITEVDFVFNISQYSVFPCHKLFYRKPAYFREVSVLFQRIVRAISYFKELSILFLRWHFLRWSSVIVC